MAGDRPFPADHDICLATLDIICSVTFSMEDEETWLRNEINHAQSLDPSQFQASDDTLEFPRGPLDPETAALLDIQKMIDRSLRKLAQSGPSRCESALDQLLWREVSVVKKSECTPNVYSPEIRDEILGYLVAGHDSTATVSSWWIKYMSRHQSVQDRLRSELRQAHASAVREGRWPTKDEICTSSIPYLDAVIEETLRYASVATLIVRTATCDTQILGYAIPKGTDVILPLKGPSVIEPALPISKALRPGAKDRVPWWGEDVDRFKPERWLETATDPATCETREIFDTNSGPNLAFSVGPRQCFGKRLAYMELKILVTLLLWNFEFNAVSESLNDEEMLEMLVNKPRNCYAKLKRL
ncbi:Cytochrome P450 [Escovopsis weberi]|uniref:Cytochrome P450 n=1 Tax=Escovopsis weberi TaxID=150374 RepID=A0A0M9VSQ9_ESCWE|nr:Cytochrome P450 [Escovopsis weberi]